MHWLGPRVIEVDSHRVLRFLRRFEADKERRAAKRRIPYLALLAVIGLSWIVLIVWNHC